LLPEANNSGERVSGVSQLLKPFLKCLKLGVRLLCQAFIRRVGGLLRHRFEIGFGLKE
jgi:hypothetical protein